IVWLHFCCCSMPASRSLPRLTSTALPALGALPPCAHLYRPLVACTLLVSLVSLVSPLSPSVSGLCCGSSHACFAAVFSLAGCGHIRLMLPFASSPPLC